MVLKLTSVVQVNVQNGDSVDAMLEVSVRSGHGGVVDPAESLRSRTCAMMPRRSGEHEAALRRGRTI